MSGPERSEVSGVEPAACRWDFDGDCAPATGGERIARWRHASFSVGVFQWVKKADGKGLKRSPAACRVKGWVSHPDQAYAVAREVVRRLEVGELLPTTVPKHLTEGTRRCNIFMRGC